MPTASPESVTPDTRPRNLEPTGWRPHNLPVGTERCSSTLFHGELDRGQGHRPAKRLPDLLPHRAAEQAQVPPDGMRVVLCRGCVVGRLVRALLLPAIKDDGILNAALDQRRIQATERVGLQPEEAAFPLPWVDVEVLDDRPELEVAVGLVVISP
jgi:hypothetical protein